MLPHEYLTSLLGDLDVDIRESLNEGDFRRVRKLAEAAERIDVLLRDDDGA